MKPVKEVASAAGAAENSASSGGAPGGQPGHFIDLHGRAEAFELARGQLDARCGQSRVVAAQVLISGLADKDAAPARSALQAAGQIHFAAENGVILHLGGGAHQARPSPCRY